MARRPLATRHNCRTGRVIFCRVQGAGDTRADQGTMRYLTPFVMTTIKP